MGNQDCLAFLLDKGIPLLFYTIGAKADLADVDGATPLHKAVFSGHVSCASVLIQKGANVDAADIEGITAVHKVHHSNFIFRGYLQQSGRLPAVTVAGESQLSID